MPNKVCLLMLVIIISSLFWNEAFSIRWLSLQHSNLLWNLSMSNNNPGRGIRSGVRSPCSIARRRYGFAKLQARLCRSSMDIMPHVEKAATLAADVCQRVFENRRWNCSSIATAPYLTADLTRATREQAYVYAISSAALTYSIARACASGTLYLCTCANKPNEPSSNNFQWGGCGDNMHWGIYFGKKFIDNVEKINVDKSNKRARGNFEDRKNGLLKEEIASVNLHNNRVGRRLIRNSLHTQCKCHGVSGSCSIKTCWKGLPPMIEIAQRLLKQYTNAIEVSKLGLMETLGKKRIMDQLLFISKSPDYCTRDIKLGSFGTVGRKCNVTMDGPNSCRQLCCGRGYQTLVEEKLERCQCKYYNCCYVKCNICRTKTQIYECG